MKPVLRFSLAVVALAPLVALAQPKKGAVPASPKAPASTGSGQVTIRNAPDGTATFIDSQGLARLTKDVVVTQSGENVTMYAQDATFDRIRNLANAKGSLRVETRESTIVGTMLYADFNERRATITGNVVITSHGKKDGVQTGLRAESAKKPIRLTCDRVDWDYDIRQATATGNIKISQGPNRGTCDSIIFDETRNIINLRGDVRFGDDKKRVFLGQDIIVFVDEGRIYSNSGTRMLIPGGDNIDNGNATTKTPRPPKSTTNFGPVPTIPPDILKGVDAPPPRPTARPTATQEPLPTPRPDETEPPVNE